MRTCRAQSRRLRLSLLRLMRLLYRMLLTYPLLLLQRSLSLGPLLLLYIL